MKYFPLIWSSLFRRKVRTLFTLLSIVIAFVLFNYLSAVDTDDRRDLWPASVHVIAKDILWFHAVIWPSMLMALERELPGTVVNGSSRHRLPNNINLSLSDVTAERLLSRLEDVAISSGSACSSATSDGSYVIKCLRRGADQGEIEGLSARSVRIGLGRTTTDEEVDFAVSRIAEVVRELGSSTATEPRGGDDDCSVVCPRPGAESS